MSKRSQQPIPNPTLKILTHMRDVQFSLVPHMKEIAEAGRSFGIDMSALVTDLSPARTAAMRRSLTRMDAALTQLEAIAIAHAQEGPKR